MADNNQIDSSAKNVGDEDSKFSFQMDEQDAAKKSTDEESNMAMMKSSNNQN